jgi:hypothetical protein
VKEALLFLKKKKQKNFTHKSLDPERGEANKQQASPLPIRRSPTKPNG